MINFYSVQETLDLLANDEALIIPDCDSALIGTYTLEREGETVSVGCYDYDLLVDCFATQFSEDCEDGEDPVEHAALQILNILFSVPQISVRLHEIPQQHKDMIAFWMKY